MIIEEKAKAYDKAIEYAHYLINERCKKGTNGSFHRADLQKMFPELQENKDEIIRKELINYFKSSKEYLSLCSFSKEIVTWLEKQGDIIASYEDKLDRCACESFDKGYKAAMEKQGEQKPAWSEEDDLVLQCCIDRIQYDIDNGRIGRNRELLSRLKSLKDRVQPQQEWSALDEKNLQGIIDEIHANKNNAPDYDLETYDRFLNWLKDLRPQK